MRFKNQNKASSMPVVDLIPMLNVMMSVLAFFVLISMTLATQPEGVEIQLPSDEEEVESSTQQQYDPDAFLIVGLDPLGEITIGEEPVVSKEELWMRMQTYLEENTEGIVLLNAEPETPYEEVMQLIAQMRDLGGERVSLAIVSE